MPTDSGTMSHIPQWGMFELALHRQSDGNPFVDIELSATFRQGDRAVDTLGFYDGGGIYRVRFMPDAQGEWAYETRSNDSDLDGKQGRFEVGPPEAHGHGPVRVADRFHFAHADGTPFRPFGTTAYVWNHQGEVLEEQTLRTLTAAPFNKVRMCVFPKHYLYNETEPALYPYRLLRKGDSKWNRSYYTDKKTEWQFDFEHFEPAFFQHLEQRIADLNRIGVEADLILFHAYDRWGFSQLTREQDDRYLRYLIARLAAYPNVWWSLANEYDFLPSKTPEDWNRFIELIARHDHAQHLRSIHNGFPFYDHTHPLLTHASIQRPDPSQILGWREQYQKPIIVDECCYEGDISEQWGNISGREMVHRFWDGVVNGGYVTHGETFRRPNDEIFWSKGGTLEGQSIPRLHFLRNLVERISSKGLEPMAGSIPYRFMEAGGIDHATIKGLLAPRKDREGNAALITNFAGVYEAHRTYLMYFGRNQPSEVVISVPPAESYRATLIDTWEMTERPLEPTVQQGDIVQLAPKPYQALLLTRA